MMGSELSGGGLRSLVIVLDLPLPISGGRDLRTLALVEALARFGPVAVFGVCPRPLSPSPIPGVVAWRSSSDLALTHPPTQAHGTLRWLNEPDGLPADRWWSELAAAELGRLADELEPDIVVVELWAHRYAEAIQAPGRCVVLNAQNAEAHLHDDLARRPGLRRLPAVLAGKVAERVALREAVAVAAADQTWAPSERDAAALAAGHPAGAVSVHVVPSGVRVDAYAGPTHRRGPVMVYPADFAYPPNEHAAHRLVSGVLPVVRDSVPTARLILAGAGLPAPLAGAAGVEAPGRVPEMLPYLHRASVMPVALSQGGGTRLKVLEASAAGVAVVSTAKGVEGLAVRDGVHFVLAESDAALGAAVLRLWDDEELRASLVANAAVLVRERYGPDAVAAAIGRALGLAVPTSGGQPRSADQPPPDPGCSSGDQRAPRAGGARG